MYNDAEWNCGHRDNILDPIPDRVSLGVTFDKNYLYLVRDFGDYNFKSFDLKMEGKVIWIELKVKPTEWEPPHIQVHYYPPLRSLAVEDRIKSPYNGTYNGGEYIDVVTSENKYAETGVTVSQKNGSFQEEHSNPI